MQVSRFDIDRPELYSVDRYPYCRLILNDIYRSMSHILHRSISQYIDNTISLLLSFLFVFRLAQTNMQIDVRGGRRGDTTKLAHPYSTATLGLVTIKHPSTHSRSSLTRRKRSTARSASTACSRTSGTTTTACSTTLGLASLSSPHGSSTHTSYGSSGSRQTSGR